jgi:DNA-binding protein WhiA
VSVLSFSSAVKNELCRVDVDEECCLLSELSAVIKTGATVKSLSYDDTNIKIITENAAFARRVFSLIKKLFNIFSEIVIRKSKKLKKHTSYTLVVTSSMGTKRLLEMLGYFSEGSIPEKVCCKKAYLRGAFLSAGSISDPEKTYHLEITTHSLKFAQQLNELMNIFYLSPKIVKRKCNYVSYLKEGENIVDFLNIIGAHTALLELENVRILKEMRNSVNRIVNCETANLEKTVNASIRQVENIKYIISNVGLNNLPDGLREIAEMRLKYSDANLKELGEMLNPPLGKSGVNHRLRKLDRIAEKHREMRGEL